MSIDLKPSHPHAEHVHAVEEYIRSAADLTKQLLGFARGGKYKVRPLDINELLSNSGRCLAAHEKTLPFIPSYTTRHWWKPIVVKSSRHC